MDLPGGLRSLRRRLSALLRSGWVLRVSLLLALALLAIGAFTRSPYWQAVWVNLGTSLLLFGALAAAEPRVVRSIEQLVQPQRLEDLQASLESIITDAQSAGGVGRAAKDALLSEAKGESVRRVMGDLEQSGLREMTSAFTDEEVSYRDTAGLGIHWTVRWSGSSLEHEVTLNGSACGRYVVTLAEGELVPDGQQKLREFESQVAVLMYDLLVRLVPARELRIGGRYGPKGATGRRTGKR